jgi:hypothetical protein
VEITINIQNLKKENAVSEVKSRRFIVFGYEVIDQLLKEQLNSNLSKIHFSIAYEICVKQSLYKLSNTNNQPPIKIQEH